MPFSKEIKVKIKLPAIGEIEGSWQPDENDEKAAWELYVELITRISIVKLKPDEGLLREALSSLYSVFGITREILKKYGPSIARPKSESKMSFGYLAIYVLNTVLRPVLAKSHPLLLDYERKKRKKPQEVSFGYLAIYVLNTVLRPVLAKWHPLLLDYEKKKPQDMSPVEHENLWKENKELRTELNKVTDTLEEYAGILAEVAKVPHIIKDGKLVVSSPKQHEYNLSEKEKN